MTQESDFVLCMGGRDDLSRPRFCYRRKQLRENLRDDCLLIDITPSIIGKTYGLGGDDITQLILATRHVGVTLFPVTEWPAHVYVYRILDDTILSQDVFDASQIEMIAWGIIYRSLSNAANCADGP
jgi:hypothetical protein